MSQSVLRKEFDFSPQKKKIVPPKSKRKELGVSPFLIKGVLFGSTLASGLVIDKDSQFIDNQVKNTLLSSNNNAYSPLNIDMTNLNKDKERVFTKSFTAEGFVTLSKTIDFDEFKENYLPNVVYNIGKFYDSYTTSPDIIEEDTKIEEETDSMYEKLMSDRDKFEKTNIIIGIVLSIVCLLISFSLGIDWGATLPGALMFISVSIFMILRRKRRRTME